jgi:hypothetical protein
MPADTRTYYLLAWQDDAGQQHVMHVQQSQTNVRLMELHAALVRHGFRPTIYQPVEWGQEALGT